MKARLGRKSVQGDRLRGIIADVNVWADSGELNEMLERLRSGDVRALARAISLVEEGTEQGAELVRACRGDARKSLRIGITGPPGAGKSTLIDQMARLLRQDGQTVAVLAVDPSSAYTGGALLGDRIRMQGFAGDAGVYFRSMASRGTRGGLVSTAEDVCVVFTEAGRHVILIETMGVGQDEIEIAELADLTALVLVPGMGDEVQSLKAGVMEIADIYVINKSEREGTELLEAQILAMQGLAADCDEWVAPVVRTVGTSGAGVKELMEAVQRCAAHERKKKNRMTRSDLRLDHIGAAVKSIASARRFYEALGLVVSGEEVVEHEKVNTAMLPIGESRIELLEATEDDSIIAKFLANHGEGLHHIAVRVKDVDAMFARLKLQGVRLTSEEVQVGAGGHRYFFIHPSSTGGVLLEIVSNAAGRGK